MSKHLCEKNDKADSIEKDNKNKVYNYCETDQVGIKSIDFSLFFKTQSYTIRIITIDNF